MRNWMFEATGTLWEIIVFLLTVLTALFHFACVAYALVSIWRIFQ